MTCAPAILNDLVREDLAELSDRLSRWASDHLTDPRLIEVATRADGGPTVSVWLVTDHTGVADASYRVVFNPDDGLFGLEAMLDTGVHWLMGWYGSFSETVSNM